MVDADHDDVGADDILADDPVVHACFGRLTCV